MSKSKVLRATAAAVVAGMALAAGEAQAGWRHHWVAAPSVPVDEPYVVGGFGPAPVQSLVPLPAPSILAAETLTPGGVVFAQPGYYGGDYGFPPRYNRPCTVSNGRGTHAVSCLSLAAYGFIQEYNGR